MLAKRKEDLSAILGQLRVVFDGKATRATGGLESEIKWQGKLGLLAGSTTVLYTKTEEYAEVGQRMVIYHMIQPDNYEVGRFRFRNAKIDKTQVRQELQNMIRDYVENIPIPLTFDQLPDFDEETQNDILDIGHLAVSARSPVSRNKFSRDKEIEAIEDKEGIGRVQGQLMTLAYGLMLQNPEGKLNDTDRRILYKIGLDCINTQKRAVLRTLTEFGYGGDIDQIANAIGYPRNVTERFVEDLFGLGMLTKQRQYFSSGSKTTYQLKDHFKDIMNRFEGITVKEEEIPVDESAALDPFNN
jgi:predicted transcriptional regulator